MEETLGKRIVACRKRLGITQDRLAEQLGVTAQAVSKWENDQSCPDIAMLPKLAEIFGISTDALLGIAKQEPETVHQGEVVAAPADEDESKNHWEFHWDAGRRSSIAVAVWIILTAGWLFAASCLHKDVSFWDILWTNGLIVFGLSGIFRKFHFFRLGCALFGIYSLLDKLNALPFDLGRDLLLPAFLLLFGLSLLVDALRKPHKPRFSITHNGKSINNITGDYDVHGDSFDCDCSFGDRTQIVALPVLRHGDVDVNFGQLTLDLTAVEQFSPVCSIDADCAFGELTILVPRRIRAEVDSDTAFGSVDVCGSHDTETHGTVRIDADASFGQISVKYI